MRLRSASAKISSGSSEPSMWMCSSALGAVRSSAGRRSRGMASKSTMAMIRWHRDGARVRASICGPAIKSRPFGKSRARLAVDVVEESGLILRHRLTVDEYLRMGEAGILPVDARVELIDGEVVDMAPMRSRHAGVVARLTALLGRAAGDRALVWCQLPLVLGERSAPEPDLTLLKPRTDFYRNAHPGASDVLLLYARHGIAEVWIVDLDQRLLRVCRGPQDDGYADVGTTATPALTPIATLPGVAIDLHGILD